MGTGAGVTQAAQTPQPLMNVIEFELDIPTLPNEGIQLRYAFWCTEDLLSSRMID